MVSLSACSDDSESEVCREPMPCTDIFLSYQVSVTDTTGSAVKLDGFEVRDIKNNKNLTLDHSTERLRLMQNANSYHLFGDEWGKEYKGKTTTITFRGFQNSEEIVSANFEVGADCCHVQLLSGNTNLVVD